MEHLPKNLQMKAEHLWNEIQQYHGDKISELLAEVPENEKITYASEHNGTWYFYKVNKDHTIEVINAIKASNDSKTKSLLKEYGLDTDTREFRNSLQADEDGGNGRVFEYGSNASDGRGLAGTNSVQDREGGWKQALETLRVDEQNSRSNASSNSSASTPIGNNAIRFSIGQSNTPNERIAEITNELVRTLNGKGLKNKFFQLIEELQNGYILLNKVFTNLNEARVASGKKALSVGQHLETIAEMQKNQSENSARLMLQMMEQGTNEQSSNPIDGAKVAKNLKTTNQHKKKDAHRASLQVYILCSKKSLLTKGTTPRRRVRPCCGRHFAHLRPLPTFR